MPLTEEFPPFDVGPTIVSCLGPGRKVVVLIAGTLITIVSGTLRFPGVQLTTPPFARVRFVTAPVRTSVKLTWPPVIPVGPAGPMKSPEIVIWRPPLVGTT